MAHLHITQVGFFKPIVDSLIASGTNVNHLYKHSGLEKFQFDDPERYVPTHSMYALFEQIKKQEGIDDVLDQFAEKIQLVSLSQWGEMISFTPDVLAAIQMAVKYESVVMSHERAGYEITGATTKYWQRFIDHPANGREQADFLSFALAINGFRIAVGDKWAPLEIHLQSEIAPNLDRLLPVGSNTRVLLGQDATAVIFPTSMLAMPMLGVNTLSEISPGDLSCPPGIAGKIEHLLDAKQTELVPDLNLITEITEYPPRTLQRKLAKEGTSLSEVVDQWRFKTALRLLENPHVRVKEISEQLNYSNPSNFDRAFRRWTKCSPNRYRELQ